MNKTFLLLVLIDKLLQVTTNGVFSSSLAHEDNEPVLKLPVEISPPSADLQRKKVMVLDMFQTEKVEDFKSPIVPSALSSFLESEIDLAVTSPVYSRQIKNFFNSQYTTPIAIGSPDNIFQLIIDTGSGTTLVNDVRCTSVGCLKRKAVDPAHLPHYQSLHFDVEISYAKGGVSIELGTTDFYLQSQPIKDMEFGSIVREKAVFTEASYDGILGLSYPALADGTVPFFDRLMQMGLFARNVFSIFLSNNPRDNSSRLFLGGYDPAYFQEPLVYHPVVRKMWWTLSLDAVLLDGKNTNLCSRSTRCEIIVDTGASLMAAPPAMYSPLIQQMSRGTSCASPASFPMITFVINGLDYTLEPSQYLVGDGFGSEDEVGGLCSIGMSIFDVDVANVWIAGDVFLTKYFSVYDRDNDRVGLARAVRPGAG